MVSKCANPDCGAPFLYFHKGKLFRLETESGLDRRRAMGDDDGAKKVLRHLEFYWLCENCAASMTLAYKKEEGITVCRNALAQSVAA
jgi:hypothetical protein